jgi:AcrR family transcriptional regulator
VVHFSNRRSHRADARRVAILKAAASVFRARGFAAAGMRHIAEAADLSAANLYHYFSGKDELLFFCQDWTLDRLLSALAAARREHSAITKRLHALANAHVLCLVGEVEGSAAHLEVDALPARLRSTIVAKRDRYERGIRALVAQGIRHGELREADPTIATRAFLGALNWTAHWYRPDGTRSAEQIAALVADYAVAGLVAGAARQPSVAGRKSSVGSRQSSSARARRPPVNRSSPATSGRT